MLDKLAFWRRKSPPQPTRRAINPLTVRDRIVHSRKQLEERVLADLQASHLGSDVPFPDTSKLSMLPQGPEHWAGQALGLPPHRFFITAQGVEVKQSPETAPFDPERVKNPGFYAPAPPSDEDRRLLRQLQELGEAPEDRSRPDGGA